MKKKKFFMNVTQLCLRETKWENLVEVNNSKYDVSTVNTTAQIWRKQLGRWLLTDQFEAVGLKKLHHFSQRSTCIFIDNN